MYFGEKSALLMHNKTDILNKWQRPLVLLLGTVCFILLSFFKVNNAKAGSLKEHFFTSFTATVLTTQSETKPESFRGSTTHPRKHVHLARRRVFSSYFICRGPVTYCSVNTYCGDEEHETCKISFTSAPRPYYYAQLFLHALF